MFSFYQLLEEIERLEEVGGGTILGGAAAILGLRHLLKRAKERDAMMHCKSECSGILDRTKREQCIVDCFNRKIIIMTKSYKTKKKIKEQAGIQNVNSFNMGDKTPNSPGRTLAAKKLTAMTNLSPYGSGEKVKGKSLVSVVGGQ